MRGVAAAVALALMALPGCTLWSGGAEPPLAALVREGRWQGQMSGDPRGDPEFRGRIGGRRLRVGWRREELLSILPAGYEAPPTDRGNPRAGGRFVLGAGEAERFEPARARRESQEFLEVEVGAPLGAAGFLAPLAGLRGAHEPPRGTSAFVARNFALFAEEPAPLLSLLARPGVEEALRELAYRRPRLSPLPLWQEELFPSILLRPDGLRVRRPLAGGESAGALAEYVRRVAALAGALEGGGPGGLR